MAVPLALLAFSRIHIVDDAFITYRYAHNLSRGYGLVFNRGEHVEGVTNLLWTLLMSVPEAIGLPVHLVAAAAGAGFAILAMFEVWRMCRYLGVAPWAAQVATLVLGLYPGYWLTATNGLEGGLFAFLLMRTLYAIVSLAGPWTLGAWGGLLFMTRPESVLLIPLAGAFHVLTGGMSARPGRRQQIQRALAWLLGWILFVATVTAWRRLYFGAWIPNTILAKSMPRIEVALLLENARFGTWYYRDFIASALMISVGAALAPILAPRLRWVWLFAGLLGMQVPIILANAGDWMPHFRLLAVYAPVMTVLLALSIQRLVERYRGSARPARILLAAAAALTVAGAVDLTLRTNTWTSTPGIDVDKGSCWESLILRLKPALLPTDRIATEAIGMIGYVTPDLYVHDLLGLADEYVARHGEIYQRTAGKFSPTYTLGTVRPDIIVIVNKAFFMPPFVQASAGTFDSEYTTYFLSMGSLACGRSAGSLTMSVRNDSVVRINRALTGIKSTVQPARDIKPSSPHAGRPPMWLRGPISIVKRAALEPS